MLQLAKIVPPSDDWHRLQHRCIKAVDPYREIPSLNCELPAHSAGSQLERALRAVHQMGGCNGGQTLAGLISRSKTSSLDFSTLTHWASR